MAAEAEPILLDTSVWVALLNGEPSAKAAIEAHAAAPLLVHPLVLAELHSAILRGRARSGVLAEVEAVAQFEPLTREDAIEGSAIWARLRKAGRDKVSLADCLILASARRAGARLLTRDSDLRREPGVTLVP